MVISFFRHFTVILLLCIELWGCAANRTKPTQGRDLSAEQTKARAEQLARELDNQTTPKQSPPANSHNSVRILSAPVGQVICVEVDSFKVFNDNVSLKEARSQTLQFVRQLALEKALPVEISINSITATMEVEKNAKYDQSVATGIFMMSASAGRFVSEKVLSTSPVFDERNNAIKYKMCYLAEIIPLEKSYNPSLKLEVKLSETLLKDGDQFTLCVVPNTAGYLYLFDFLSDGSAALVFPNPDLPDNALQAGEKWERTLRAVCDKERDYSIETLYFIYSTVPINGWEDFRSNRNASDLVFSAGEESFILFQKWLGKSDPAQRVEKLAQLHICK